MRRWLAAVIGLAFVAGGCGDAAAPSSFPSIDKAPPRQLEPGRYRTTLMTPRLSFEVGDGWLQIAEYEPLLLLSRAALFGTQADFLNFVTFPDTGPEPVIDAIRSVAALTAGAARPVTVGGIDGVEFSADVAVPGGGAVEVFAFPNNVLYNRVPLDPPRFADGDRARFTILEVGDDTVVVLAGTAAVLDYEAFIAEADAVLATEFST